ncbi:MAG TPA: carboxypeptidase-like regulatory domain-containing protein, partial [Pyrinomonadaceae bacterium]|nr:carboxypeptidase-like regulatory domain-containing protein [Pyrinomonadaceae bacterium]
MSSQARLFFVTVIVAAAFILRTACVPGQSTNEKTPATGAISGRVTIAGKGAANITVAAYSQETINQRKSVARAVTDGEGRYRLTGLPPAQYQVASLTPDLTPAEQNQVNDFSGMFGAASKSITLAAGEEVENVDLKLVRGGVITGRVTDANNKPVVEEQITLVPVDDNGNLRNIRTQFFGNDLYQTDDRGVYRIYGLAPGRYKVSAGMESGGGIGGVRGFYPRTFYPDTPDQTKARVVEVTEGSEATGIDIQLGRQEVTFNVSGRVVDAETGQPVVGGSLSYLIASENPERFSPFYMGEPTNTRGEFKLTGLPPGRFGVYLSAEFEGGEYYSEVAYFEVVDKDVTNVEVKATRGLALSGLVVIEGAGPDNAAAQLERLRISAAAMQPPQERNRGASRIARDGSFRIGGLRA